MGILHKFVCVSEALIVTNSTDIYWAFVTNPALCQGVGDTAMDKKTKTVLSVVCLHFHYRGFVF